MTNAQRKQTLHLARLLLARLEEAETQHPDRAEHVTGVLGITVSLAEHLTRGFADPNPFSLQLLEVAEKIVRRILAGEEVPLLVLEGEEI